MFLASAVLCLAAAGPGLTFAQSRTDKPKTREESPEKTASIPEPHKLPPMQVPLIAAPPAIDGILDDAAWNNPPLTLGEWLTYRGRTIRSASAFQRAPFCNMTARECAS
jgi:hypothetical protein